MDPIEGRTIGQYVVESRIGGGGMGVVYRAHDTKLRRSVALKFLPADQNSDRDAQKRFIQEAQTASALDHPNICTIHDTGETDDGRMFIVMSLYDGETLDSKIADGPIDPHEALGIAAQAARGLSKAHSAGITHRDIKPANLMVTSDGIVKILDFGIAKIQDVVLTKTNRTIGTVSYMAPEQLRGEPAGPRTDIWALGVTLYEMIAGERPFQGEYEAALLYAILNEPHAPLSTGESAATASAQVVLDRCLEKSPEARYGSASELAEDLERAIAGDPTLTTQVRPPPDSARTRGRVSLRHSVLAAAALAVLLLVARLTPVGDLLRQGGGAGPDRTQLAVLPFENVGLDQSLVDGLVYTITSKLAQIEQFQGELSVVPASDIFGQHITSSRAAADELNVGRVVSGSVQKTTSGFRLTVDLVDARSGRVAESRTMDVESASITDLPRNVVSVLTGLLHVDLSPRSKERLDAGQTGIPAAYDFYTRAVGYLQRFEEESNVDAAVSLFGLAIKEDSSFALAYAGRGEAYLKKYTSTGSSEYVDAAVRDGQRAVDLGEDLPAVRNAVGRIYYTQGDYQRAELEFLRALASEPNHAETYRSLGNVYYHQDRLGKAEEAFRKAIELKPDYWLYYNELGIFYDRVGRHEDAIDPFMQVVALRPTNPWGYNNTGVQYHNLGRLDEALTWYRQAAEVNPNARGPVALALGNMASIEYARDHFEEAAELGERVVRLRPQSAYDWDLLGDSRHWLGQDDSARVAWRRVIALAEEQLEVNPHDSALLTLLGQSQAKLGMMRAARDTKNRILSLDRVDFNDMLTVAKIHEVFGERDSALIFVTRAFANGAQPFIFEASGWLDDLRRDPVYVDLAAQYVSEGD